MQLIAEVVFGYSRSKGQYHVEEIRGSWPVARYERSVRVPNQEDSAAIVQMETITVHVGDWLTEGEAQSLGIRTLLVVRPYRIEGE